MTPELYRESYLKSIENLNLDAGDIKRENYVIKIVKKAQLDMFAEELIRLSNLVVKNNYRLTGVEIEFDRQCRPVRKIFRLQNREGLEQGKASAECMQEFSYSVWKMKFDNAFEEVRKKIE